MMVGIATRAHKAWVTEFQSACDLLKVPYRLVDIDRNDWMDCVRGIDILMWRIHLGDYSGMREARLKIPLLEEMGVKCFPNTQMANFYDDKIGQTLFFQKNKYPIPETFVSFSQADALDYARQAKYPIVAKTSGGAASSGVSLVRNRSEAERIIKGVFKTDSRLVRSFRSRICKPVRRITNQLLATPRFLGQWASIARTQIERYVYFQEYIETSGDVRVVTLGPDLVSAFTRGNRPNDFRASGSGLLERFAEDSVPKEPCEMALKISRTHGFSSMAYDFLSSRRGWLIGEISYTFLLYRLPWDYKDALFERRDGSYIKVAPVPIGVLHLKSMLGA